MDRQVLEQLDAIYSKENLEKDSFFREMTQQHPEGWITLKKLSSIKRFKTLINGDISMLIAAANLAPERFELDADQTKLRALASTETEEVKVSSDERLDKIKDYWSYQNQRSIYAKGFPSSPEPTKSCLMELFEEFGRVIHIKYRREEDKTFKGSIFVEFETNEMAAACLKKEHRYEENDLLVMNKQDYVDMKAKDKYAGMSHSSTFGPEGKSIRHYVEFSGAEGLGVHGVKEILDGHSVKVGKFEFMKDLDGVGILQLSDDMSAEGFFATLDENNTLGPLSFRLASDEQRIEYRRISKERIEKMRQRGNNRGRGRGRGNGGFKRRHNGHEGDKGGEKRRRDDPQTTKINTATE